MADSYVRLKHTLADLALSVVTHSRRDRTAAALVAYARISRLGQAVGLEALARAASMTPAGVRRVLLQTRLFAAAADGRKAVALALQFHPDAAYFYRQAGRLGNARRALEAVPPRGVSGEIWRAAVLFNAGLFFECHEYLEDFWRAAGEPERTFYHGLVQAAAGCYHLEKRNLHGASMLLGKALEKLRPYAPAYLAIDVAVLLAGLDGILTSLWAVPPGPSPPLPRLRILAPESGRRRARRTRT